MGFVLFLLLNAVFFVRPADFIPALLGLPIYNVLVLACLAVSFPELVKQLQKKALAGSPLTVGVLMMFAAVVVSHLHRFNLYGTRESTSEFLKVVLYYLMLVGLVDTTARLRRFLFWLGLFILVLATVPLLQYHELINVSNKEAFQTIYEYSFDQDGERTGSVARISGAGIFNNPNMLARILVTGMIVSAYWLTGRSGGMFRFLWAGPLAVMGYALMLTRSRGGLMALMAATGAYLLARFGWKRAVLLGLIVVPVPLVVVGGRQTELSTNAETAQERIKLWREGWALFTEEPLFGIGMGQYVEEVGMVAHNSYLHCFTELGFFGGTVFAGLIYLALRPLFDPQGYRTPADPALERLRPFVMAMVAGEAVGMMSISRSYATPTYMLLGLAAVYQRLAGGGRDGMSRRLLGRVLLVGVCALTGLYIFVRLNTG